MSEVDLIEKLAMALEQRLRPSIPLNIALWDISTIAKFVNRNEAVVRERLACKPDFPAAIRLPTETGKRGHALYKAKDVICWVDKYIEKRT